MTTALGNKWRRLTAGKKEEGEKKAFRLADSFFIWRPPRSAAGASGDREIGAGGLGVCVLCSRYERLCNGNKLNFKPPGCCSGGTWFLHTASTSLTSSLPGSLWVNNPDQGPRKDCLLQIDDARS